MCFPQLRDSAKLQWTDPLQVTKPFNAQCDNKFSWLWYLSLLLSCLFSKMSRMTLWSWLVNGLFWIDLLDWIWAFGTRQCSMKWILANDPHRSFNLLIYNNKLKCHICSFLMHVRHGNSESVVGGDKNETQKLTFQLLVVANQNIWWISHFIHIIQRFVMNFAYVVFSLSFTMHLNWVHEVGDFPAKIASQSSVASSEGRTDDGEIMQSPLGRWCFRRRETPLFWGSEILTTAFFRAPTSDACKYGSKPLGPIVQLVKNYPTCIRLVEKLINWLQ